MEYKAKRSKDKVIKKRQTFYSTKLWIRCRDMIRGRYNSMCIMCLIEDGVVNVGDYVHHIHTTEKYWDMRLQEDNLVCLCATHHACVHRDMNKSEEDERKVIDKIEDMITEYKNNYSIN